MGAKVRVDVLLVERGLVGSRERARALILAGRILVNEQKVDKAGTAVEADCALRLLGEDLRYVSRGGLKLEGAIKHWKIAVQGRDCVDVGTSTGGFTDCLLQHGALRVHCVDTGAGQIHWKLRTDPRVVLHEQLNARYLQAADMGEPVSLIVCDVSFISVTLLLPALIGVLEPAGEMIILVKPQFEVGRENVGKGGIVREPELHAQALHRVCTALESAGFHTLSTDSPILGAEGNRELLVHARR